MRWILRNRRFLAVSVSAVVLGSGANALLSVCGPFPDVAGDVFCPFVLEIFYLNITTGVTPTTYDPASPVSRLQMAAFLSRTVDRTLQHANLRTSLERHWLPQDPIILGITPVGLTPRVVKWDGRALWVMSLGPGKINRVKWDGKK